MFRHYYKESLVMDGWVKPNSSYIVPSSLSQGNSRVLIIQYRRAVCGGWPLPSFGAVHFGLTLL